MVDSSVEGEDKPLGVDEAMKNGSGSDEPFFVLGCVRSGTTFLRDCLRRHPDLACPEETHFYRWADPFGTKGYMTVLRNNKVLARHREIDGINQEEFEQILNTSATCRDLYNKYMKLYMKKNKPQARRWFDKTPQNVYGVGRIINDFPNSKLIHLVRDPIDVVASLKVGNVISVPEIRGASHYWAEAVAIMNLVKAAHPEKVLDVRYEDLTDNFYMKIGEILEFLNQPFTATMFEEIKPVFKSYKKETILQDKDLEMLKKICGPLAKEYGYLQN